MRTVHRTGVALAAATLVSPFALGATAMCARLWLRSEGGAPVIPAPAPPPATAAGGWHPDVDVVRFTRIARPDAWGRFCAGFRPPEDAPQGSLGAVDLFLDDPPGALVGVKLVVQDAQQVLISVGSRAAYVDLGVVPPWEEPVTVWIALPWAAPGVTHVKIVLLAVRDGPGPRFSRDDPSLDGGCSAWALVSKRTDVPVAALRFPGATPRLASTAPRGDTPPRPDPFYAGRMPVKGNARGPHLVLPGTELAANERVMSVDWGEWRTLVAGGPLTGHAAAGNLNAWPVVDPFTAAEDGTRAEGYHRVPGTKLYATAADAWRRLGPARDVSGCTMLYARDTDALAAVFGPTSPHGGTALEGWIRLGDGEGAPVKAEVESEDAVGGDRAATLWVDWLPPAALDPTWTHRTYHWVVLAGGVPYLLPRHPPPAPAPPPTPTPRDR
ncbi:MAG TPA: hypothetical protein VG389_07300 [Myxococcota bacterium]|jgi:hypothetical protein|nr:hypothetical protein [Myxococcota bacterium]